MNTDTRQGDWMSTFAGGRFWPLDPRADEICIEDIAHALSHICRFGGHVIEFYSVAQHSVYMSRLLEPHGGAKWGLLHDAAEAYIGDMVRPLKRFMPEFRDAEVRIMEAIIERFNLGPEPHNLKDLDNQMIYAEAKALLGPHVVASWSWKAEPPALLIEPWDPMRARREFLARWAQVCA